jgi:hypothetical protein
MRQDGDQEEAWLRARPWWGRKNRDDSRRVQCSGTPTPADVF